MTEPFESGDEFEARWRAQTDQLILARAQAIDAYAGLERALSNLFSLLIGVDQDLAALVFYRILATRSRNEMMQDLIARTYGAKYKRYWASMFRFIQNLDTRRNRIVHWHLSGVAEPALAHPKHFLWRDGGPEVRLAEVQDFIDRTNFAAKSITVFWLVEAMVAMPRDDVRPSWLDIFLQPLTYPIPEAHPLSRWMPGPKTQHPPSEG